MEFKRKSDAGDSDLMIRVIHIDSEGIVVPEQGYTYSLHV